MGFQSCDKKPIGFDRFKFIPNVPYPNYFSISGLRPLVPQSGAH
jgi:hypothetical protein